MGQYTGGTSYTDKAMRWESEESSQLVQYNRSCGSSGLRRHLCLRRRLGPLDSAGVLPMVEPRVSGEKRPRPMANEPEAVLESPRDGLEVAHAASAGGLSALGLLAPLVRPELSTGVAALRAL